jgi:hypothetical protein
MNAKTPPQYPIPASLLRIEGDPTSWGLTSARPGSQDWGSEPVALATMGPLVGTLVLSPRVGSFALLPPPPGDGWVPAVKAVAPFLYIPTPAGLSAESPGYWLAAPDDNLAALQEKIMAAMQHGTALTVQINTPGGGGVIVLNGAELSFVVLGDEQGQL